MKQQMSFAGWDFGVTWTVCTGGDYHRGCGGRMRRVKSSTSGHALPTQP
jgi:hypothetical protein